MRKHEFLTDFNEELCRLVCELIDIQPAIERTKEYKTDFAPNEIDFREAIHPKKDFHRTDPEFILSLTIKYSKPATVFYPT